MSMCVVVFFHLFGLDLTLVGHIVILLMVSGDKRVIPVSCWERVYLLLTCSTVITEYNLRHYYRTHSRTPL